MIVRPEQSRVCVSTSSLLLNDRPYYTNEAVIESDFLKIRNDHNLKVINDSLLGRPLKPQSVKQYIEIQNVARKSIYKES